jgi:hypothetical protein
MSIHGAADRIESERTDRRHGSFRKELVSRLSATSRGWVRYVVVGVIALLLIAVAVFVLIPPGCGSVWSAWKSTSTGECLGVVYDTDTLDPALHTVAQRIFDENDAVGAGQGHYVKMALLTPLSVSKNSASAMSLDQVRASLEGAFTAQYRANHLVDFGDPGAVRIQMVLVNQGSRQDYSADLVEEVLDLAEKDHPLVAVVGLGSSFVGTEETARALAAAKIPMVTAVASAVRLNMGAIKGLRSVSPSNEDYAEALRQLLDQHQSTLPLNSAIIVADQNDDDPYVKNLEEVYSKALAKYVRPSRLTFHGGTVGQPATSDVFDPVVTNLCSVVAGSRSAPPLNTVLFAGRLADFRPFADVLAKRICKESPLAVLVGATGFAGATEYVNRLDDGKITVIYASSADAPAWSDGRADPPEGFKAFLDQFHGRGFADASLLDGYAIMYHDAMASAARATKLAAQGKETPTPADVDVQFGNLTHAYAVRAASGTLSFAERADGRASGKPVVYRQLGTNTPFKLPDQLRPYCAPANAC